MSTITTSTKIDPDNPPLGVTVWEASVYYWDANPCAEPELTFDGYYATEGAARNAARLSLRGKVSTYSEEHGQHNAWDTRIRSGHFEESCPYLYSFEPDDA